MHYSGILVRSQPAALERCATQVNARAGVEVYLTDPSSSSLVVVVETRTLGQQEATLRALQDLPDVVTADLVYHYIDEATDAVDDGGAQWAVNAEGKGATCRH